MNLVNGTLVMFMWVSPSASDMDIQNNSFAMSKYESRDECEEALVWIQEHKANLDRHIWCGFVND